VAEGFKVADAYVELTLSKDRLQPELDAALADVERRSGPQADRSGKALGDKLSKGMKDAVDRNSPAVEKAVGDSADKAGNRVARSVEQMSGKISKARRAEIDAANAVTLAEKRLLEARQHGLVEGSARELSLVQALEKAQYRLADSSERAGDDAGNKLSRGMSMAIVRNSPLIVAGVAAALAAGGPLLATAAVGAFAAVGIVAAAQSEKVKASWLGAFHQIRDGAVSDSAAIQPILTQLASTVVNRFESIRPVLRNIFADAAPQISVFAHGMLDLTQNVLPGFQRVIGNGMTVTMGFASFLDKLGTGIGGIFDRLANYAPSIGLAWSQLGDVFAQLGPLIGELLGRGAQLATIVLPALSGSLSVLLGVATQLGPALPLLISGFGSFKLVQTAGGWVEKFGGVLTKLGTKDIPLVSTAASKVGGVLASMGSSMAAGGAAAGAMAAVLAVLMVAHQSSEQKIRNWTQAIIAGGNASKQAYEEMGNPSFWDKFIFNLGHWGNTQDVATRQTREASQAAKEYLQSLDPLERAQHLADDAQKQLNDAVDKYGPTSKQAADAQAHLSDRQAEVARVADEQERAIRGVTQAMLDQVDQARALIDKQFAMEDALKNVSELTQAYTDAINKHGKSSKEAADALDELERGYRKAGQAASDLASSNLPAKVDDQTKAYYGARAELQYYHDLMAKGIDLPPELDTYVALLERQAGGALSAAAAQDVLGGAIRELGVAVQEVPGEKAVIIKGEGTEELRAKLAELGFTIVQLPNGQFKIVADTPEAEAALSSIETGLAGINGTTAKPGVELQGTPKFYTDIAASQAAIAGLDGSSANPKARLDTDVPGKTQTDFSWLGFLDKSTAKPQASLKTTVVPQTQTDIGAMGLLGGQLASPTAQLTDGSFKFSWSAAMNNIAILNGQRPTPVASLNPGTLPGTAQNLLGITNMLGGQRPTPVAGAIDNATGILGAVKRAIDALYNRTVYVTTVHQDIGTTGRGTAGQKAGGKVIDALRGFAVGGSPGIPPDGKVRGPGGPTDDKVPAIGPGGARYALSATEWIIKAISAGRYGDRRMAAVNDGTATILLPGEEMQAPIRAAVGGPLSRFGDRIDGLRERMADVRDRAQAAVQGTQVHVDNLTVKIETPLNLMSAADLRKAAQILRAAIIGLERETS
jgi:hypothetical protein